MRRNITGTRPVGKPGVREAKSACGPITDWPVSCDRSLKRGFAPTSGYKRDAQPRGPFYVEHRVDDARRAGERNMLIATHEKRSTFSLGKS